MAAQLFELITLVGQLVLQKPKKIYKSLADQYQNNLERSYGEHLIRQVILTKNFSYPSEDSTGIMNKEIANKTRENQQLMYELQGKEVLPTEEIQIGPDDDGKRVRRKKKMENYDPIVFEECYVKHRGLERIANSFELDSDKELARKIDPTAGRSDLGFEA